LRDGKEKLAYHGEFVYAKSAEICVVDYEDVVGMRVNGLGGGFSGC
jgi:hypothetical protein